MVDRYEAVQWAKESGFEFGKGPLLFDRVTPDQVFTLVSRVLQESYSRFKEFPELEPAGWQRLLVSGGEWEPCSKDEAESLTLRQEGFVYRQVFVLGQSPGDVVGDNKSLLNRAVEAEAKVAELEQLCDATYVAQGADAYNHACEEMERWQFKRLEAGKEPGTVGSLCDGTAWLQGRVEELEAEIESFTSTPDGRDQELFVADRLTNTKAQQLCAQHGYTPTGYLLSNSKGVVCSVNLSNVQWFSDSRPFPSACGPDPMVTPVFWYRLRSDGGFEGPIHNSQIEEARKQSGAWIPLCIANQADRTASELELHRADYKACQNAGFESPGELLSAHKTLSERTAELQAQVEILRGYLDRIELKIDSSALSSTGKLKSVREIVKEAALAETKGE